MAGEVAKAYVTLIPSARGFKEKLRQQINKPVTDEGDREGGVFGESFGKRFDGTLKTLIPNLGVAGPVSHLGQKTADDFERSFSSRLLTRLRTAGNKAGSYFTSGFASRVKKSFSAASILPGLLAGLGPALVPALAAATGAVGALGSALGAAGIGVGGFAAIAVPAFTKVQKVTEQVQAAQKAYNLATTDAGRQAALRREQQALAGLTPGERELAKVLGTLKNAWEDTEKALQPTVVKALIPWVGALRDGLRFLGPVVRPVSKAIGILGNEMRLVFRDPAAMRFFRQIGSFGAKAIQSFGVSAINLGKGLASLLLAFRPISNLLLAALPNITAQFSNWAASLSGSKGFQSFIAYVTTNGPRLMSILGSIIQIAGKLISGLAPLGGVLLAILAPLGRFLASLSPTALMAIALGIAAALAIATGGFTAIVTTIVLVAAIIVRNWSRIRNFITGVVSAVVNFIRSHWKLIVSIIGGPLGAVVALVVSHWNRIKSFISSAVARVRGILAWFGSLPGRFRGWFGSAVSAVTGAVGRMVSFVRGIPGRILRALGNLGSLLYNAGRNVIQGLINGIKSMFGAVGGAIGNIVGFIRDHLPFSPAKVGPLSGRGSPLLAGRKIAAMLASGMADGVPGIGAAAGRLAGAAALVPAGAGGPGLAGAIGGGIDVTLRAAPGDPLLAAIVRALRADVATKSGGSVQRHLGKGTV